MLDAGSLLRELTSSGKSWVCHPYHDPLWGQTLIWGEQIPELSLTLLSVATRFWFFQNRIGEIRNREGI